MAKSLLETYKKSNSFLDFNIFGRVLFGYFSGMTTIRAAITRILENPASSHPTQPYTVYKTQLFVNSVVWEKHGTRRWVKAKADRELEAERQAKAEVKKLVDGLAEGAEGERRLHRECARRGAPHRVLRTDKSVVPF